MTICACSLEAILNIGGRGKRAISSSATIPEG